jgi:uncharacterized membrane protein
MKSSEIKSALKAFFKTFAIFIAFDSIWLTKIAPRFYQTHIGHLMAASPDLSAALAFYIIFIAGVTWFAVLPSSANYRFRDAFGRGAFFGLVAYATFDLTCQATLKDWPLTVTIVDLIWGTALTGLTTAVAACKVGRTANSRLKPTETDRQRTNSKSPAK